MRKKALSLLAVAALAAPGAGAGADVPRDVAYVSNQDGGVTVIDLTRLEPIKTIDVGGKGPRGIAVTPDGKYLLTANQHTGDVSVVDTTDDRVVRRIPIGKNPEFLRISPDGNTAFVTYEPSATGRPPTAGAEKEAQKDNDENKTPAEVAVIDLGTGTVIRRLVAGLETEGIEFTPDGKSLAVTNEADNTITVYDLTDGKLVRTVDISAYGNRPRGIKISPNGSEYAVTMEFSDKVLILDRDFKLRKTVATEPGPYGVAFDRDGRYLWVDAARGGKLQVFDTTDYHVVATIAVGKRCWHFTFTPDGARVLEVCGRSNSVYVIDAAHYRTAKQISGLQLPWAAVTYPNANGSLDVAR
jgi:YVTN family beta-propeller protein